MAQLEQQDSAAGTVAHLARHPLKSARGESLAAAWVGPDGLAGDRAHALARTHKGRETVVTGRETPRLLAWSAAYPAHPDDTLRADDVPLAQVTAPWGEVFTWGDERLVPALAEDLGFPVSPLRRPAGIQDLAQSVLITFERSRAELDRVFGKPIDIRRFRTNIHIAGEFPPFAEEQWEGARLRVGDAEIELLHPCKRCAIPTRDPETQERDPNILRWLDRDRARLFGINARVLNAARIAVGDRVELAAPAMVTR